MNTEKIKMIKSDAIINVKIGSGFIKRLHQLLFYFSTTKSKEDFEKFQEETKNASKPNFAFSEDWMNHFTTLSILIKEIENEAEAQNFTYEKELSEFEKEIESFNEETD